MAVVAAGNGVAARGRVGRVVGRGLAEQLAHDLVVAVVHLVASLAAAAGGRHGSSPRRRGGAIGDGGFIAVVDVVAVADVEAAVARLKLGERCAEELSLPRCRFVPRRAAMERKLLVRIVTAASQTISNANHIILNTRPAADRIV